MKRHWSRRAEQAFALRRLDESDDAYRKAIRWTWAKAPLTVQRARIARLLGKEESFEQFLDMARFQGASGTSIRLEKKLHDIQSGRIAANRSSLSSLLADPLIAPATLEAFATGYLVTGEVASAQQILESWLKIDPQSVIAHSLLGQIHFEQENYKHAETEFRKAAIVNPDLIEARLGLARTCYSLDKTNESIDHFAAVLALDPGHVESILSHATLLIKRDGSQEAAQELESLITERPDLYAARYELASFLSKSDQHERVAGLIEPLMNRFPDDIALNYLMGGALSAAGQRSKAAPYLDRYLTGRRALDRWSGADFDSLADSRDASAVRQIALDYARYQWDESSPWLHLAVEILPRDGELHRVLSEIYEKNGDQQRAERHRQIADLLLQSKTPPPSKRGNETKAKDIPK